MILEARNMRQYIFTKCQESIQLAFATEAINKKLGWYDKRSPRDSE